MHVLNLYREGRLEGGSTEVASVTLRASPNTGSGQSGYLRSQSVTEGQKNQLKLISAVPDHRRGWSDIHGMNVSTFSPDSSRGITPRSISNAEVSFSDWDEISRRSPSLTSRFSSCSSRDMDDYSALTSAARAEAQLESQELHHSKEDHPYSSPPSVLVCMELLLRGTHLCLNRACSLVKYEATF